MNDVRVSFSEWGGLTAVRFPDAQFFLCVAIKAFHS
jgi:hypothetical protein